MREPGEEQLPNPASPEIKFTQEEAEQLISISNELKRLLTFYIGRVAPVIKARHQGKPQSATIDEIVKDEMGKFTTTPALKQKLKELQIPNGSYISSSVEDLLHNLSLPPHFMRVYTQGNYKELWQDILNCIELLEIKINA